MNTVLTTSQENKANATDASKGRILFQKYFYYIVILQVIVVAAIGYVIAIRPAWNSLASAYQQQQMQRETVQREVSNYQDQAASARKLVAFYNQMGESERARIEQVIPVGLASDQLFAQLHALIERNGLTIDTIELAPGEKTTNQRTERASVTEQSAGTLPAGVTMLELKVSVVGARYQAFKALLYGLERNLRLFDIQSVDYDPGRTTAAFAIRTYYIPGNQPVSSAPVNGTGSSTPVVQ